MESPSKRKAFVCAISAKSKQNYEVCRRLGLWGFTAGAARYANRIGPGDLLWVYIGGRGVVALSVVVGAAQGLASGEEPPWRDGRKYAAKLPIRFVAELTTPVRPDFPKGFGGWKSDPVLGFDGNTLQTGFFEITGQQHALLAESAGGEVPEGYVSLADPPHEPPSAPSESAAAVGATPSLPGLEPRAVLTLPSEPDPDVVPPDVALEPDFGHTKAQWQLARIGRALGLSIWIPKSDRQRRFSDETLGELSILELPSIGFTPQALGIVTNIDVLWIENDVVVCAFEVEHSTVVYSGLLRLSDLLTVQPYASIRLFVVAGEERKSRVARELARPTFSKLHLSEKCKYVPYGRLQTAQAFAEEHGSYLQWQWVDGLAEPLTNP